MPSYVVQLTNEGTAPYLTIVFADTPDDALHCELVETYGRIGSTVRLWELFADHSWEGVVSLLSITKAVL